MACFTLHRPQWKPISSPSLELAFQYSLIIRLSADINVMIIRLGTALRSIDSTAKTLDDFSDPGNKRRCKVNKYAHV